MIISAYSIKIIMKWEKLFDIYIFCKEKKETVHIIIRKYLSENNNS